MTRHEWAFAVEATAVAEFDDGLAAAMATTMSAASAAAPAPTSTCRRREERNVRDIDLPFWAPAGRVCQERDPFPVISGNGYHGGDHPVKVDWLNFAQKAG